MNEKVLVLGAGTSGCTAALFLAQHGLEVCLIDRVDRAIPPAHPVIGESLSPDAVPLLKQLDIWEEFCAVPHLKCYGNVSYWYSQSPQHHDFLQHPVGHGWHLDRSLFDRQLLDRCQQLGIDYRPETSLIKASFKEELWNISLKQQGTSSEIQVSYVVDATGRNSWWARQQGIERLYEAEQLALVAFLEVDPGFEDSRTLVETTEQGWWYSATIPGNRMATAFFFDPNLLDKASLTSEDQWKVLLKQATQTHQRISEANGQLFTEPKLVAAHSSILEHIQGPGWLAVGDAALTYDPIAAHGITMAMCSARDAAQAIAAALKGNTEAPQRYEAVLWAAFQRYAQERQQFTAPVDGA